MDAFVNTKFRASLSSNINFADLSKSSSSTTDNADATSFSLGKHSVTKATSPPPSCTTQESGATPTPVSAAPAPSLVETAPKRNGVISFSMVGAAPSSPALPSVSVTPVTADSSSERLENTAPAKRARKSAPEPEPAPAPAPAPVSSSVLPETSVVVSATQDPPPTTAAAVPTPAPLFSPAVPSSESVSVPPYVASTGTAPAYQSGYGQISLTSPPPPPQERGSNVPYWWTPELEHFVINWRPSVSPPFGNYKVAPLFPAPPPPPTYLELILLVLEIAYWQDDAFQRQSLEWLFEHGYLSREDALRVYYGYIF